jgi:hypothetical protein
MFLTVQIPVMDDQLSLKKRQQLDRLTGRDTTVPKILAFDSPSYLMGLLSTNGWQTAPGGRGEK